MYRFIMYLLLQISYIKTTSSDIRQLVRMRDMDSDSANCLFKVDRGRDDTV